MEYMFMTMTLKIKSSRENIDPWKNIPPISLTVMSQEIVAIFSLPVEHMNFSSGTWTQANKSLVELRCWEMKDGQHGRATLAGPFKESIQNVPMELSFILLTEVIQPFEIRVHQKISRILQYWLSETTTVRFVCTISLAQLKTQTMFMEWATLLTSLMYAGLRMTTGSFQSEERINVWCTGESKRISDRISHIIKYLHYSISS